jgi:hypothetical protein
VHSRDGRVARSTGVPRERHIAPDPCSAPMIV